MRIEMIEAWQAGLPFEPFCDTHGIYDHLNCEIDKIRADEGSADKWWSLFPLRNVNISSYSQNRKRAGMKPLMLH